MEKELLITSLTHKKIPIFQKKILEWFSVNGRTFPWRVTSASFYEKIIAEILLQRTKATSVASFFQIFITRFPSWHSLAISKVGDIAEFIHPIGLYNQKAKKIHDLGIELDSRNYIFPNTREELEKLPGVGQYIASSILLFCFQQKEPLLDVNMQRVIERFFGPRRLVDIRYDPYLQNLSRLIVSCSNPIDINYGVLDFASLVCKIKEPLCLSCLIRKRCLFFNNCGLSRSEIK
jgi:A/G-specific adenine glycosylase